MPKPPHLAARGGCWFEDAGVKVHLGVEADFHPARKAHPALVVEDLPAGSVASACRTLAGVVVDEPARVATVRVYVDDAVRRTVVELLAA